MPPNEAIIPTSTSSTEAEAVAKIIRASTPAAEVLRFHALSVLAHETGKRRELESLERFLEVPTRKRAKVQLRDYLSFIAYVKLHATEGTTLFAEITETGGTFTAIIDYHGAKHDEPRWGDHVCSYAAEHTPEWKRWLGLSGKAQNQTALALFIEDNLFDIVTPEPARMLEMVKTLEATQGVEFKSAVRLDNGDRQLHYAHQTVAKAGQQGDMEIPERFTLRMPVFANGPAYEVQCRFRYQIREGALTLSFEVERPHKVIDLALHEARCAITSALNLPVLLGMGAVTK